MTSHYLNQWWLIDWPIYASLSLNEFNTLRPRQNGRHFADDIFKRIFFNENVWILNKISLKFVPKGPINIIPALFRIMAWRRPGVKPLSEAMLVSLLPHICVTRPQWVNQYQSQCSTIFIPPATKLGGVYWIQPVCLSVCPSVCLSVCLSVNFFVSAL